MDNQASDIFDVANIQKQIEKMSGKLAKNSYIKSMSLNNSFPVSALFTQQMNYSLAVSLSYLLSKTPNYLWTLMPGIDEYVKAFDEIQKVNATMLEYSEKYYNFLLENLVTSKNNGEKIKSSQLEALITGVLKTYLTKDEITY